MLHRNDGATFTGTVTLLRDPPSIPQLNPDFGPLIDRAGPELAEERGFSVRGPSSPPGNSSGKVSVGEKRRMSVWWAFYSSFLGYIFIPVFIILVLLLF
jgi:hypothetical protein